MTMISSYKNLGKALKADPIKWLAERGIQFEEHAIGFDLFGHQNPTKEKNSRVHRFDYTFHVDALYTYVAVDMFVGKYGTDFSKTKIDQFLTDHPDLERLRDQIVMIGEAYSARY